MTIEDDKLFTVRQVQEFLGESESAVRKRLQRGELPYIKISSAVRIRKSDLEKWLEARTIRSEALWTK